MIIPPLLDPVQPCFVTPFLAGISVPLKRPEYVESTCYVALMYQHVHRTIAHVLLYFAKGYRRFQVHLSNPHDAVTPGTTALRLELTDAIREIVQLVGRENVDVEFGSLRYFRESDGWYERYVYDSGNVYNRLVGDVDPR